MTVHICPICDHEVKLPHDCPSEKPMTDTRKPYDPTWPHGFETRDGRKVTKRDWIFGSATYWDLPDNTLFITDDRGRASRGKQHDLDVFCTAAPVGKPLECWVNVLRDGFLSGPYRSEFEAADWAKSPIVARSAVHMREVTAEPLGLGAGRMGEATFGAPAPKEPGSLSAAEVEKLATRWSGWWRHDGCSVMWHEAADALRGAARGEW